MEITASMVKELRVKTGAGMMDCKKALVETSGDTERAIDYLREKGIARAAGKAGRDTTEGLIVTHISDDKKQGAIVEFSCETDFVARTDGFRSFVFELAKQVASQPAPADLNEFLARAFAANTDSTVAEAVKTQIGKLGENMSLRRVQKFEVSGDGALADYIHPGDKLGTMVEFNGISDSASDAFKNFSRDVAMHIAAASPQAITRDSVDAELIKRERDIYRQQALNEGKPERIVDRIVNGKIDKFFSESALLEQTFVKDSDMTVGDLIKKQSADLGDSLAVSSFARFLLGG